MSEEQELTIVNPTDVEVGDVVTATVVGWGGLRAKVQVTGVAGPAARSTVLTPTFALGLALEEVVEGKHTVVKMGESVPLYWPNNSQMDVDRDRFERELPLTYAPVLHSRGGSGVGGGEDLLADWEKEMATLTRPADVTLRNPDVAKMHASEDNLTCQDCDARAKYYYPKTRVPKCINHRDRSMQDANDPPRLHEMYVAWDDDPMDAHHFV